MKAIDSKFNIAIIIRNFDQSGGGAERYCVELTKQLSINHNVAVFCQKISTRIDNVEFYEIKQKILKPRFINQLIFSFRTQSLIKNLDFDIVHSHDIVTHADIYTAHVPCFKNFLTNSKGLIKLQHLIRLVFNIRKITYLTLEHKAFNQNKTIISVSKLLGRNIAQNYRISSKKFIAYPGINFNHNFTLKDKKNKEFSILFIANNFIRKGLKYLINAIELINDNDIRLLVVGNDKPNSLVIKNKDLLKNINFYGKVDDMETFYENADILVHPTHGDTFGMVVLEAMSHGLPVVVSNSEFCGISEVLTDNLNASILNDHKDIKEIASKIRELKNNHKYRQNISSNALKFAKKSDWTHTMKSTLAAYKYHINSRSK